MNIVVCDDSKEELDDISRLINDFSKKLNIKINIQKYTNPLDLLSYLKYVRVNQIDAFILDIIMQENGIEIAKKIRQMGIKSPIIFSTTSKEYALDAFKVHAFDYILKPVTREQIFESFLRLVDHLNLKAKTTFSIKNDELNIITIDINEIMYIESNDRRILFHMINKEVHRTVSLRTKFSESVPFKYKEFNFISCHSSFIVNMNMIKAINEVSFILKNNETVPISKKYLTNVKKLYAKYLLGE